MENGWIILSRSISSHWIWKDPIKLKWWIDMLLTVNFKDNKINIGNEIIECKRGQSVMSLAQWAERWRVDKSKVRNFFILLTKDNQILHENLLKTTRITICNYDSYQGIQNDNKTQSKRNQNAIKTQSNPIETSNNANQLNNEQDILLEKETKKNTFEFVWNLYGKKGNRKNSISKFSKLKQKEVELIISHVPVYLESVKDKQYLKNFETYLNQRHWETEINGVLVTKDNSQKIEYVTYFTPAFGEETVTREKYEKTKRMLEGGGYVFTERKSIWK